MPELRERDLPRALLRELPRLKQQHGHIYAVKTSGGIFAVRALNWKEFRTAREKVEREVLPEVEVAKMGLLWPEEIPEDAPAGVFHTLCLVIMNVSGFDNPATLDYGLAWAEQELEADVEHTLIMTICKAFPAYKPEDLYEMDFLDLMIRFKQAEMMLGMGPSQVVDPGQPQQRRAPRRTPQQPIQPIGDETMVFGSDEEFIPSPARSHDPLRDPNPPPIDFAADNKWFKREGFVNDAMRTRHPGEV